MSDRARYRDFYDLFLLLEKYPLNLTRNYWIHGTKRNQKNDYENNILKNWLVIGTQKEAEMTQIYYSRTVDDEQIKAMIGNLPFVEIS